VDRWGEADNEVTPLRLEALAKMQIGGGLYVPLGEGV